MYRFLPIMVAAGRVRFHRLLVAMADATLGVSLYLIWGGVLHWSVFPLIFLGLVISYAWAGYKNYFLPVQQNPVLRVVVGRDFHMVSISLIVMKYGSETPIFLPVKIPHGYFYQVYVLYVYMRLGLALSQYAKKIKSGDLSKCSS